MTRDDVWMDEKEQKSTSLPKAQWGSSSSSPFDGAPATASRDDIALLPLPPPHRPLFPSLPARPLLFYLLRPGTPQLTGLTLEKPNRFCYYPNLVSLISYGKPDNMSFREKQESSRSFDSAPREAPTPIHEEF
ncbi:hypothetical protein CRG98_041990 [Punica granatum]|uniref:Uncharacterized protein n=1 Tax=Punica granatum TaxID=22663 RepID=A0A2I0I164_PUNGR|nr:hypothetical protein CRG98_041990 [Punica granatum]